MKLRRTALAVLAGLVALIGVVVLTGLTLPAQHVATGSARLAEPPERVWARITAVEEFASWRPDLQSAARTPDGWVETDTWGDRLPLRVTERVPPRRLVTEIADPSLPFGGTWTYELRAVGSGTELTITERGVVRNPVFRFVSRFVLGHDTGIRRYLAAISRRGE